MDVIGLINRVGYLEPIEYFTSARIEDMNSLREVIAALFSWKFYHGESYGGAIPKESRLESEGIARGTIYVGIQICTKYSFFVKPTVLSTRTQLSHKHHHHGGAVCPSVLSGSASFGYGTLASEEKASEKG